MYFAETVAPVLGHSLVLKILRRRRRCGTLWFIDGHLEACCKSAPPAPSLAPPSPLRHATAASDSCSLHPLLLFGESDYLTFALILKNLSLCLWHVRYLAAARPLETPSSSVKAAAVLMPSASCRESSEGERQLCKTPPGSPGLLPVEAGQGQGCSSLCPGLSPPAPLLAPALLARAHLAPSPWHRAMGRWFVLLWPCSKQTSSHQGSATQGVEPVLEM